MEHIHVYASGESDGYHEIIRWEVYTVGKRLLALELCT
jgi:hypothetical protein